MAAKTESMEAVKTWPFFLMLEQGLYTVGKMVYIMLENGLFNFEMWSFLMME